MADERSNRKFLANEITRLGKIISEKEEIIRLKTEENKELKEALKQAKKPAGQGVAAFGKGKAED